MAHYEVEVSRTAEKQLRKLPRDDQERVVRRMPLLAEDPIPRGARNASDLGVWLRVLELHWLEPVVDGESCGGSR